MHEIFTWVTYIFIILYSGMIVFFFISQYRRLVQQNKEIKKSLQSAVETLRKTPQKDDIVSTDDEELDIKLQFKYNFGEISDSMKQNRLFAHNWSEFCKTLVHIEKNSPIFHAEENPPIYSSHSASLFFNEDTIILPHYAAATYAACPNYFTGLGILGTFIGLAGGIYFASPGLSGTLGAAGTAQLQGALSMLLAGSGLAFTTSIVGLLCSLRFSIIEKRSLRDLHARLRDFVSTLDERVCLITAEDISRRQLSLQEEQRNLMQIFVDDLGHNIGDIINSMFSEKMAPLFEKMVDELVALRRDRATDADVMTTRATEILVEKMDSIAGKEIAALASALSETRATLLPLLSEYKALQDKQTQATKQLNEILQRFADLHSSLERGISNMEQGASTFASAARQVDDVLQSNAAYTNVLRDETKNLYDAVREENRRQEER